MTRRNFDTQSAFNGTDHLHVTTDTLTTTEMPPKHGPGAPLGNKNRTKHGLRASGLPPGCSYLEGQLASFRRYVRDELESQHGPVELYAEAVLQSAVRHETRALLCARWLRLSGEELDIDKRASLLRDMSSATDARDKCLKILGLDRSQNGEWPTMDATATPAAENGSAAASESMDTGKSVDRPQDAVSGDKTPEKVKAGKCVRRRI